MGFNMEKVLKIKHEKRFQFEDEYVLSEDTFQFIGNNHGVEGLFIYGIGTKQGEGFYLSPDGKAYSFTYTGEKGKEVINNDMEYIKDPVNHPVLQGVDGIESIRLEFAVRHTRDNDTYNRVHKYFNKDRKYNFKKDLPENYKLDVKQDFHIVGDEKKKGAYIFNENGADGYLITPEGKAFSFDYVLSSKKNVVIGKTKSIEDISKIPVLAQESLNNLLKDATSNERRVDKKYEEIIAEFQKKHFKTEPEIEEVKKSELKAENDEVKKDELNAEIQIKKVEKVKDDKKEQENQVRPKEDEIEADIQVRSLEKDADIKVEGITKQKTPEEKVLEDVEKNSDAIIAAMMKKPLLYPLGLAGGFAGGFGFNPLPQLNLNLNLNFNGMQFPNIISPFDYRPAIMPPLPFNPGMGAGMGGGMGGFGVQAPYGWMVGPVRYMTPMGEVPAAGVDYSKPWDFVPAGMANFGMGGGMGGFGGGMPAMGGGMPAMGGFGGGMPALGGGMMGGMGGGMPAMGGMDMGAMMGAMMGGFHQAPNAFYGSPFFAPQMPFNPQNIGFGQPQFPPFPALPGVMNTPQANAYLEMQEKAQELLKQNPWLSPFINPAAFQPQSPAQQVAPPIQLPEPVTPQRNPQLQKPAAPQQAEQKPVAPQPAEQKPAQNQQDPEPETRAQPTPPSQQQFQQDKSYNKNTAIKLAKIKKAFEAKEISSEEYNELQNAITDLGEQGFLEKRKYNKQQTKLELQAKQLTKAYNKMQELITKRELARNSLDYSYNDIQKEIDQLIKTTSKEFGNHGFGLKSKEKELFGTIDGKPVDPENDRLRDKIFSSKRQPHNCMLARVCTKYAALTEKCVLIRDGQPVTYDLLDDGMLELPNMGGQRVNIQENMASIQKVSKRVMFLSFRRNSIHPFKTSVFNLNEKKQQITQISNRLSRIVDLKRQQKQQQQPQQSKVSMVEQQKETSQSQSLSTSRNL
ncbi:MAG: hypothetical protein Ta2D_01360 [Rickettsiales bacterium]|nr:MAG: hypothetical protein Ta2D_01360 [Rickettsiales bacterium]